MKSHCWSVVVNAGMVVYCFAHLPAILGCPMATASQRVVVIFTTITDLGTELGDQYLPVFHACGGARQDASFEAALPIYDSPHDMSIFNDKC